MGLSVPVEPSGVGCPGVRASQESPPRAWSARPEPATPAVPPVIVVGAGRGIAGGGIAGGGGTGRSGGESGEASACGSADMPACVWVRARLARGRSEENAETFVRTRTPETAFVVCVSGTVPELVTRAGVAAHRGAAASTSTDGSADTHRLGTPRVTGAGAAGMPLVRGAHAAGADAVGSAAGMPVVRGAHAVGADAVGSDAGRVPPVESEDGVVAMAPVVDKAPVVDVAPAVFVVLVPDGAVVPQLVAATVGVGVAFERGVSFTGDVDPVLVDDAGTVPGSVTATVLVGEPVLVPVGAAVLLLGAVPLVVVGVGTGAGCGAAAGSAPRGEVVVVEVVVVAGSLGTSGVGVTCGSIAGSCASTGCASASTPPDVPSCSPVRTVSPCCALSSTGIGESSARAMPDRTASTSQIPNAMRPPATSRAVRLSGPSSPRRGATRGSVVDGPGFGSSRGAETTALTVVTLGAARADVNLCSDGPGPVQRGNDAW